MQGKKGKFLSKAGLFALMISTVLFGESALAADSPAVSQDSVKAAKQSSDYSGMKLIPYGKTSGIKLYADGIMVVELSPIRMENGEKSPAASAGIEVGDMITHFDGEKITSTEHFISLMDQCSEKNIRLTLKRDAKTINIELTPCRETKEGKCRIGALVRDSMAGIGTITFVDPKTGNFGALGHGICDIDTGKLIPFSKGSIVPSSITSIKKGISGTPGELRGEFDAEDDIGFFYSNTTKGIFGVITEQSIYSKLKTVSVGKKSEIKLGRAVIVSNISGNSCELFDIEITKIYDTGIDGDKNMMISVTDKDLLSQTGGIVQGMSGSPILQDGKLIGAVTHVLINDPTKGYAIFIENMLENLKLESTPKAA